MRNTALASTILLCINFTKASPLRRDQPEYQIQWGPCPEGLPPSLDCGQLQVPVNWNNPSSDKISIGMNRLNATNPANKIGSVIINPGGPGGLATQLCYGQAVGIEVFGEALAQKFDIICPDPRGIGTSTPIICDPQVWNEEGASIFPSTQDEFEQLVAANKARGENCLNLTGPLLQNVDSISVAKDFEAIRIALNDGPLNYLAVSYGSVIGVAYAQLFPDNIRTIAIDGIVDHTESPTSTLYAESTSYENELNRFFQWCAANATACGFSSDNIPQAFDDLVAAADKSPIPAPACLTDVNGTSIATCSPNVTGADIRLLAQNYLQSKFATLAGYIHGWDFLGLALNQSISQNNATLLSPPLATSNTSAIYPEIAVACLDFDRIDTSNMTQAFAELKDLQIAGNGFNQHVGPGSQAYTIYASCVGWPAPVAYPQGPLNQTALSKIPEILMVNAVHDPSTSYIWALSEKEQISNAVLLTRQGDGHTSYFLKGEAAALMDTYVVNRTLPAPGTVVQS